MIGQGEAFRWFGTENDPDSLISIATTDNGVVRAHEKLTALLELER